MNEHRSTGLSPISLNLPSSVEPFGGREEDRRYGSVELSQWFDRV
jgi:hypothetical protein